MKTRAEAAMVISQVLQGKSLTPLLSAAKQKLTDPRDQRFLQALCYGVCRDYFRLQNFLQQLVKKPIKETDLEALLLVGLFQLEEMRLPPYAAIKETVNAVIPLQKSWAKGLVNAVLRNFLRQREELKLSKVAQTNHPTWMVKQFDQDWGQQAQDIIDANNVQAPMTLRVNLQRLTREDYLNKLDAASIQAQILPDVPTAIMLTSPVDPHELPGFAEGDVSIQDAAAQLAATLLPIKPGNRILDACAAPGGKTAHLCEREPQASITAVDHDPQRMLRVHENLTRLKLTANCITEDVGDVESWWDGQLFDAILLDAPCSASGVIRRHPDIKLLRKATDIPNMVEQQQRLLKAVWPLLKPSGQLLYVTCSVFKQENEQLIESFLSTPNGAEHDIIVADWGMARPFGRQLLPGMQHMDGFYYARLTKQSR